MATSSARTPRPTPQFLSQAHAPAEDDKFATHGTGFRPRPIQGKNAASVFTSTGFPEKAQVKRPRLIRQCKPARARSRTPRSARPHPVVLFAPSVMRQASIRHLSNGKRTVSCTSPTRCIRTLDAAPAPQDPRERARSPLCSRPLPLRHLRGYVGFHRRAPISKFRPRKPQLQCNSVSPPFAPPKGRRVSAIAGADGVEVDMRPDAHHTVPLKPAGDLACRHGARVGRGEHGAQG
ncbi:hypothetical protein C8J57DRAFT_336503 [Mycena rebaudengoi]|nr:hypothetical protein C8J57DRAFT_336503 [Mycena rebaudengoi]